MSDAELLPCPFCGKADPVLDGKSDDCVVRCEGCGARGKMFFFDGENDEEIEIAENEAMWHWNTRAALAQQSPEPRICQVPPKDLQAGADAYRAAPAAPVALTDEPVAWLHDCPLPNDCDAEDGAVISARSKAIWMGAKPEHVEHYTIPLYRHPPALEVPQPVERNKNYARFGDMTPPHESVLIVNVQEDGDVCLRITNGLATDNFKWADIEFCASGGKSVNTLHALHKLAAAIAADDAATRAKGETP